MTASVKYNFEGSVVLVTGANSGMGLVTANAFAEAGALVVMAGRNEQKVNAAVEKINANDRKAVGMRCDVTNEEDVKSMVDQIVSKYGRLDAAFNNAGVISTHQLMDQLDNQEWDRIMTTNLQAVWYCMKYELRQMLRQGSGAIVNNSSMGGLRAASGLSAYSASKHGVLGLTKTSAVEYATKGIRINAICPGMIDTPMADDLTAGNKEALDAMKQIPPIKRFGSSEEIASAVLWLCCEGSSYVIGHALAVDGGITV
jgi:NAD(P)-dependent dehydrogenase (short-subunit alcohol dehydrogenase family)